MDAVVILWIVAYWFTRGFIGKDCGFFKWPVALGVELRRTMRERK